MRSAPKFTVFDIAKHLGLAIEYSSDVPDNFCGCLVNRAETPFILINSNLPEFEQRFTIAHEIAHYQLHHNRPRRRYSNWFLDQKWKSQNLARACHLAHRALPRFFNAEWEADLWAMCLQIPLGASTDLEAFLQRHPEKLKWFTLVAAFYFVLALPRLVVFNVKKLFRLLFVLTTSS